MSQSHEESGAHGQGAAAAGATQAKGKSSARRLTLITIIMLGFAALTWGPSLWSRNLQTIFIPAWLTLTIGTVVISMWFARYIITAEKYRDNEETTHQVPAAHSH